MLCELLTHSNLTGLECWEKVALVGVCWERAEEVAIILSISCSLINGCKSKVLAEGLAV